MSKCPDVHMSQTLEAALTGQNLRKDRLKFFPIIVTLNRNIFQGKIPCGIFFLFPQKIFVISRNSFPGFSFQIIFLWKILF